MASWSCAGPAGRRVYTRALGLNELGFYYDSCINGTADTLMHTVVQISPGAPNCFAPEKLAGAWNSRKAQSPLLGGTVDMHDSLPSLVVGEEHLKTTVPGEITWASISSPEEAAVIAINGERKFSEKSLSRIVVLARTDDASMYHVLINVAHLITDGIANVSLLKEFLEILSLGRQSVSDIEARLSLAVATESLVPTLNLSVAKQRWRCAAGQIIAKLQDAKRTAVERCPDPKGHSQLDYPHDQHGITVGNALPVLARVFCRRYVRGEISPEEWEERNSPMYHTVGPINLRPFLNKAWYQGGGQNNVSVNVAYFYYTLPFTPASLPRRRRPGARQTDDSETLLVALQHNKDMDIPLLQASFVLRGRRRTSL
ncbi:hypothetical protein B0H17DRAFT_1173913 [Mycena rosella]|uniref:Uncharacterized protein n=1 Tax=Mycena rosella TaxID=1033263 RepID=A0AAD7H1N8_MYCRO|nr:hypothetical protein B0H17DRAFT_1173913 [Mycena rosella]